MLEKKFEQQKKWNAEKSITYRRGSCWKTVSTNDLLASKFQAYMSSLNSLKMSCFMI